MVRDALLAYLHFLAIFSTVAMLIGEMLACRHGISGRALKTLTRLDVAFFASAMVALVTGGLRVFLGAKGAAFYLGNPVFYAKLGLFVIVGLVSIAPTVRFIRWAKASRADANFIPPSSEIAGTRRLIHAELLLLALIPLMAVLMARGIGH